MKTIILKNLFETICYDSLTFCTLIISMIFLASTFFHNYAYFKIFPHLPVTNNVFPHLSYTSPLNLPTCLLIRRSRKAWPVAWGLTTNTRASLPSATDSRSSSVMSCRSYASSTTKELYPQFNRIPTE